MTMIEMQAMTAIVKIAKELARIAGLLEQIVERLPEKEKRE